MNFLLEIGVEEVPAHLVTPSIEQLKKRTSDFLEEHKVTFQDIKIFSTPRRLSVLIIDIAPTSKAYEEELRGPSIKVAKDNDGNWTKAALGFVKGKGGNESDLVEKDGYVYYQNKVLGIETSEILQSIGREVIEQMKFSTYMKWANNSFQFVRPIRWILAKLGEKTVDFEVVGVRSSNYTYGHRVLSQDAFNEVDDLLGRKITIENPEEYQNKLFENFVIVDADQRKQEIRLQIQKIAADNNWVVDIDEDLLEEVNNILEMPTLFLGQFDQKYLEIPDEVLITSMKDNQRYFYVTNQEGKLLPYFIAARNGDDRRIDNIVAGNEKVLVARLEDADFFFKEDSKKSISEFMEKVDNLVFHAKIGSVKEHMSRSLVVATAVAKMLNLDIDSKDIKRAFEIYKFDLTTNMVNEFDELQGVMSGHYARIFGENSTVSDALYEQYLPTSAEGILPKTPLGALLSTADRIDSLISFFAAGFIPNGANDPYALRRAANGIIRIIENMEWNIDLDQLLETVISDYSVNSYGLNEEVVSNLEKVEPEVISFFIDRLRQNNSEVRSDLLDSALTKNNDLILSDYQNRIDVLQNHAGDENFNVTIENLKRISNIVEKETNFDEIDPALFETEQEKNLYQAVSNITNDSLDDLYIDLTKLVPSIQDFFESVMVNAEDPRIKNNRLALLNSVNLLSEKLGDVKKIVSK
ncbi:MAG: glycine--tRNA ligase subunit beta [Lactobacillaceae bacterium]|jgi:glycyl-tRNA synthetase beta chain|nr:glycine--tRNA ligase subunit beta [Lactobacillaceae bacterium]